MLHAQESLDGTIDLHEKERDELLDQLSASLQAGFASLEIEQAWLTETERGADFDPTGPTSTAKGGPRA